MDTLFSIYLGNECTHLQLHTVYGNINSKCTARWVPYPVIIIIFVCVC